MHVGRGIGSFLALAGALAALMAVPAGALAQQKARGAAAAEPSGASATGFSEELMKGRQALEKMQDATEALTKEQDATKKADLEKTKRENAALAKTHLKQALNLSDAKTNVEDVNLARYYLCFLAWDASEYYDAAVLGEFLAKAYPNSMSGRQGARIALAAYVKLASDQNRDVRFEQARIDQLGNLIFDRWGDQEEAQEAALTLLNYYATGQRHDKIVELLEKIPPSSPRRGQAELRVGQTLWSLAARAAQLPAGERPPQSDINAWRKQARQILTQGIDRSKDTDQIDPTLAAAAFSMAQICLESGETAKAVEWLEHPKFGPLTLVKSGHPVAARDAFGIEANKLALRTYIAMSPQQLAKAEAAMDALDKLVAKSGDAKAAENLTAIYVSLGRELEKQLESLRASGRPGEADAVAHAFDVFLQRLSQRKPDAASLSWVGGTYYNMGVASQGTAEQPPPPAITFFQKAAAAYERMLEAATSDPKYQEQTNTLLAIRLRLADCQRKSGKFDDAIKALAAVLKEKPNLLAAQVQAAETYQAQGKENPNSYYYAVNGSNPGKDGRNLIWGWGRISKVTQPGITTGPTPSGANNPAAADMEKTFHQSRMNLADSRLRFAQTEKDKTKRNNILEAAKQDLWITYKLQPQLGGPVTASQYEQLLKQIQKQLGTTELGLAEFKDRDLKSTETHDEN